MNKNLIWTIPVLVLALGGAAWLYGQNPPSSITLRQPQPEVLVVNLPTPVTISAVISGDVISGGVNLLRIGVNGQSTVLGQLSPNVSAGANGYAIAQTFNEPGTGTITLQLSIAIRGQLRRLTSKPFLLAVSTKAITLPPDPGEAGKATLAGIDSDKDGVRDDVQRYIVFQHPESEKTREAMKDAARALQAALLASNDKNLSITASALQTKAANCLAYVRPQDITDIIAALQVAFINTEERFQATNVYSSQLKGLVTTSPRPTERKFACSFNVDGLGN